MIESCVIVVCRPVDIGVEDDKVASAVYHSSPPRYGKVLRAQELIDEYKVEDYNRLANLREVDKDCIIALVGHLTSLGINPWLDTYTGSLIDQALGQ